jgi:hypothetical protein
MGRNMKEILACFEVFSLSHRRTKENLKTGKKDLS